MHFRKKLFLIAVGIFICAMQQSIAQETGRNSYFNMDESKSDNLEPFPKWTGVMERFQMQAAIDDSECGQVRYHPCTIKGWKELIVSLQNKPLEEQLTAVNNWSNAHPYIIDQLNWGVNDYWETPYEFMELNGDCEDYAISKYYSLRALGVPPEQMRVMIVQDLNLGGIIHAILGVYNNEGMTILDNQITQLMPAMNIYHYRPIYGVNETAWWVYTPRI